MPRPRWTAAELALLRKRYPTRSNRELVALLDGRHTERAIALMACRLGLKKTARRLSRMGTENVRVRWRKPA